MHSSLLHRLSRRPPSADRRPRGWARFLALCTALACGGCSDEDDDATRDAVSSIAGRRIDPAVVDMVRERDEVSAAQARSYVADVLRMAAAAGDDAERSSTELIDADRREHLLRAARARVWLQEGFESRHRPQDIPDDDPMLQRAMQDIRVFHPRLHVLCQLVAKPTTEDDLDAMLEVASDPQWQAAAKAMLEPVARRAERYVPKGDPEACQILGRLLRWVETERGDVQIGYEQGVFDLDACAQKAPDGTCEQAQWVPEWTEQVEQATGPGLLPPFQTRFGWHLVYIKEIAEPREADGPDAHSYAREHVHPKWQAEAFAEYLDALRKEKSVKLADPTPAIDGGAP